MSIDQVSQIHDRNDERRTRMRRLRCLATTDVACGPDDLSTFIAVPYAAYTPNGKYNRSIDGSENDKESPKTLPQLNIIAVNGRFVEYDGQPLCPDAVYDDCRYPHLNEAALSTICVGNYVECPTRKSRVMRGVANFPTLYELRIAQDNKHTRQKIQDSQKRKPQIHIGGKF